MMDQTRKRFLVATDHSDQAFEAIRYVGGSFPPSQLEVVLLHVYRKIPDSFWDLEQVPGYRHKILETKAWATQQQRASQVSMEKAKRILLDVGFPEEAVHVRIQTREMSVGRHIIKEAQGGYSGVVVGRIGMSPLKNLVLGSVSSRLISNLTNVPICVVGGAPEQGKILVAVDGSEGAMGAVDFLGKTYNGADISITILYVLRGLGFFEEGSEKVFSPEEAMKWIEYAKKGMGSFFDEARMHLEKAGFDKNWITTKIITDADSRSGTIVEEARQGNYGTIVMGRRGLSRVKEFFIGRVSDKVLQLAKEMAVWVVS